MSTIPIFFLSCRGCPLDQSKSTPERSSNSSSSSGRRRRRGGGWGGTERHFTTRVARAAVATTATTSTGSGEERTPFGGRRAPHTAAAAAAAAAAVVAMAAGSLLSGDVEARGDTHVAGNNNIGSSDATSDAARSGGKSPELGGLREIDASVSDSGGVRGSGGCDHGESAGAAAVGGSLPVGLSDPGRIGREMDG